MGDTGAGTRILQGPSLKDSLSAPRVICDNLSHKQVSTATHSTQHACPIQRPFTERLSPRTASLHRPRSALGCLGRCQSRGWTSPGSGAPAGSQCCPWCGRWWCRSHALLPPQPVARLSVTAGCRPHRHHRRCLRRRCPTILENQDVTLTYCIMVHYVFFSLCVVQLALTQKLSH